MAFRVPVGAGRVVLAVKGVCQWGGIGDWDGNTVTYHHRLWVRCSLLG